MAAFIEHPEILTQVESLLLSRIGSIRKTTGGYTPAIRFICEARSGRFFVKAGTTPYVAGQIRREISVYRRQAAPCMPKLIAADAEAAIPILILEDLSSAHWPPPWTKETIASVVDTIHDLHSQPTNLEAFEDIHGSQVHDDGIPKTGWAAVADDPAPFLSLNLVSQDWLESALPTLMRLECECPTWGDALCHWDLRSDNLCISSDGAVKIIDWNLACRSNPRLDLGFWLPSLQLEGGPAPETILPDAPEVAAWVSGFFASRAGLPAIPDSPGVRGIQLAQLRFALPWVAREMSLPIGSHLP